MHITLRQLRYFAAVVEQRSFSRAADSIFVSQPALSHQIRELEDHLGSPLLERESRGIVLTPLGRQIHTQSLRVLDEVMVLETMGKRYDEGPFKPIVGIISTLAPYLLTGLLERIAAKSPRVELEVVEARGQELVSDLLAGHLDAAILSLPVGLMELTERKLFEDRLLLAGRAEFLAGFRAAGNTRGSSASQAQGSSASGTQGSSASQIEGSSASGTRGSSASWTAQVSDLAQFDLGPLLSLADGHCLGEQIIGASAMWRPQEVHRGAQSLSTLMALAASGAGLTLVPESAALTERAAAPDLELFRLAPPEPARHISLIHRALYRGSTGSIAWPRQPRRRAWRSCERRARWWANRPHRTAIDL